MDRCHFFIIFGRNELKIALLPLGEERCGDSREYRVKVDMYMHCPCWSTLMTHSHIDNDHNH